MVSLSPLRGRVGSTSGVHQEIEGDFPRQRFPNGFKVALHLLGSFSDDQPDPL
jgi:hypothetical protein